MSKNGGGKSLKGLGSLSAKFLGPIEAAIQNSISSGGVEFTNITIAGGTIDGVVIGDSQPGPGIFTTLQSGNPTGIGYTVCFFGLQIGKSACWLPNRGAWDIKGDLVVRDISELGNLTVSSNSIFANNLNGNINLSPNGSGILNITGGVRQNTLLGDIEFNSGSGNFNVSTDSVKLETKKGGIVLESGTTNGITTITNATSNLGIATISTSGANPYATGEEVRIEADGITGYYTVNSTPTATSFTVILLPGVSIPTPLTSGTIVKRSDITLESPHVVNIKSESVVIDGNLLVKGTTTTVDSITLSVVDPVISVGAPLPDGKDRGVSSKYFNVSEKTSFFGRSDSSGCFTYIPDATEVSKDIFTGAPGCARFGSVILDNITLSSGALNLCNITCPGDFTITSGSSIRLLSPDLSTSSNFLYLNSPSTVIDKGITFNYFDGTGIKTGFSGFDASAQSFVFLTNTTNTAGVITGTPAPLSVGNTIVSGDLIITGNLIGGNVSSGQTTTIERLTLTTTAIAPSANVNITFVSVNTASSILTATLAAPVLDGFIKDIIISNLAVDAQYRLLCPTGLLIDPGSGSTAQKTLKFTTSGQSANLVWDNTRLAYFIRNAGCCIE
jgi:hypothetical protein